MIVTPNSICPCGALPDDRSGTFFKKLIKEKGAMDTSDCANGKNFDVCGGWWYKRLNRQGTHEGGNDGKTAD